MKQFLQSLVLCAAVGLAACQPTRFAPSESAQPNFGFIEDPIFPPPVVDPVTPPPVVDPVTPPPVVDPVTPPPVVDPVTPPPVVDPVIPPPVVDPVIPPPVVDPVTPPPVVDPVIPPPAQVSNGTCKDGERISDCANCQIPKAKAWRPGTKAEKLAEIMWRSCSIPNASDPVNYPGQRTREEIFSLVQSCSAQAYPETALTREQNLTIETLRSPEGASLRQRFFGGVWHQPSRSDHFEDYFGLLLSEARYNFCYRSFGLAGDLLTYEYKDRCIENGDCWISQWPRDAQRRWQAQQKIRNDLRTCMSQSRDLPPLAAPNQEALECSFEKFEGNVDQGAIEFRDKQLRSGREIRIESDKACIASDTDLSQLTGRIRIIGILCPEPAPELTQIRDDES